MNDQTDFSALIRITSMDALKAATEARSKADSASYRMAVRQIFAGAEGILWYAKSMARAAAKMQPETYSALEIAALNDETYVVAENGTVKTKPNFIPMVHSMKLVADLMSRKQVSVADFTFDQKVLATIKRAVAVRNRLTHPKSGDDLLVTEEEFNVVVASWGLVLAFTLNTALEADKRLGTGIFPVIKNPKISLFDALIGATLHGVDAVDTPPVT
ncbi:hypothetical protein D7U98_12930 [Stenotrophomonas maltophilia]|uniref:hypothetical protein n=1 Tax=Stenotrophomonas maltophilia TaxID=40324 RepID=UPI0015DFFA5E|nr:hypothetical protein [Stenotrophomonas maltophilia]MBA0396293.1 hypothetical protein [Stenotrophomonas maltophilia]